MNTTAPLAGISLATSLMTTALNIIGTQKVAIEFEYQGLPSPYNESYFTVEIVSYFLMAYICLGIFGYLATTYVDNI